ncbi:protein RESTRICTED TEV MOVEMENT 2 isoform X1 [Cajanus cajan]|uniref:protein RESTRICTED TEV MOVEMENT 2 isoform X1 n=1 Tax=Cajanus cajan TaxID=3821 RepID=UPI00098DCC52|nr:protein RESTRICTED TEV MOVEMENT 2 isoform X1 [Cajanus cajan]
MSLDEKTNVQPPTDPFFENFVPPSDWDRKKESDTLILMLPGFRKEQLKVQVSSKRVLKLSGERKISENKSRRFNKEEDLQAYHDTSGITAKFEAGMLYVKIPKIIDSTSKQEEPSKPDQQPPPTTDDNKPDQDQEPTDQKEDKTAEPKTEPQPPPLQKEEQKVGAEEEDSQKKPEKEEKKEEPEAKSKSSEADEEKMHGATERVEEEKESGHEDLERKLSQKEKGKAEENDDDHGNEMMGSGGPDEGLFKRSVAKMKERGQMISGLVEEVKKQNKMAHFVVLICLVLLIGIYIKNVVKSSFGGPKNQEL